MERSRGAAQHGFKIKSIFFSANASGSFCAVILHEAGIKTRIPGVKPIRFLKKTNPTATWPSGLF
jgi:hypothetical protein